ncbi:MAG: preprotein translocase subunit YajC [Lachnospiraceae bacterium]|nr:preprotein translocase subunit YajC [Lachnospiraceae bacterium]
MNFLMAAAQPAGGGSYIMIIWIVVLFVFLYFFMIRPQRKEQQKKRELMNSLEVGDTVLTTSGFYGTVIDLNEDTVIVEFGSNRNCRIPMQRAAISAIEKPQTAAAEKPAAAKPKEENKDDKKQEGKGLFGKKTKEKE